jgi:hypothetical protein
MPADSRPFTSNAYFNDTNKPTSSPIIWDSATQAVDQYLSFDYPTHALFAYKYNSDWQTLFSDAAKPMLVEWMLGQQNTPKDERSWTGDVLKGVRQRLSDSATGVFTPAFAPFDNTTSGNGDGVSVTRYLTVDDASNSVYRKSRSQIFQAITSSYKNIARKPYTSSLITTGAGNDVTLPGLLGNGIVSTGAGNDIILSSPQLHIVQTFDSYGNGSNSWENYIYYPIPYALKGTDFNPKGNTYNAGDGDDLVYYDGGTGIAKGDEGNDIIAPSFGSFNWALDSLISGDIISGPGRSKDRDGKYGFSRDNYELYSTIKSTFRNQDITYLGAATLVNGNKALLAPLTIFDKGKSTTPNFKFEPEGYGFYVDDPDARDTSPRSMVISPPTNAGLVRNSDGKVTVERTFVSKLGGQQLYGGAGNDIIYGLDPDFYKGFKTAGDGKGQRIAFNYGNGKPERQHAQVYRPVQMFGGTGTDQFSLGNPRNIDPESFEGGGDYLYRISGNSDRFARKDETTFGTIAEPDVFELNLSYQGNNWSTSTVTVAGNDVAKKPSPSATDLASMGFQALGIATKALGMALGAPIPIFGAFASLGSFAMKAVGRAMQPKPRETITEKNIYYRDPIGDWRKKVNIQDFDPFDAITIKIDPSNDQSDRNKRWENVVFSIAPGVDTGNRQALDLSYQLSSEADRKPLVRLEDWGDSSSSGAWYGYDFDAGKLVPITQKNLGFFGQVVPDSDIKLPAYQDQYRFPVPDGTSVFRWTDTELDNDSARLNQLRSNSERIVLQLDTMTLGYYWDIRYSGQTNADGTIDNLSVNKDTSKLWIRRNNPKTGEFIAWDSYSLRQTETDKKAKDFASKAKPVWLVKAPVATSGPLTTPLTTTKPPATTTVSTKPTKTPLTSTKPRTTPLASNKPTSAAAATKPRTRPFASTKLMAAMPEQMEPSASLCNPSSQDAFVGVLTGSNAAAPLGVFT